MNGYSLNLVWRADRFSLGNYGFAAIGAYTTVLLLNLIGAKTSQRLPSVLPGSLYLGATLLSTACLGLLAGVTVHGSFELGRLAGGVSYRCDGTDAQ